MTCNVAMFVKSGQNSQLEYNRPRILDVVQLMKDNPNNVWLVADNIDEGNIFVTHNLDIAIQYIQLCDTSGKNKLVHVQGYPSYESAYAVALNMRECSPYCYDESDGYISDLDEFINNLDSN